LFELLLTTITVDVNNDGSLVFDVGRENQSTTDMLVLGKFNVDSIERKAVQEEFE
jgi:hypothetical protein